MCDGAGAQTWFTVTLYNKVKFVFLINWLALLNTLGVMKKQC